MTRWTVLLAAGDRSHLDQWIAAANSLVSQDVSFSVAALAGDDRKGLGEVVWSIGTHGPATPTDVPEVAALLDRSGAVQVVDTVAALPFAQREVLMHGPRTLRTLLIRVRPATPPDQIAAMERALVAMPDHIDAIRSWSLSRLEPSDHPTGWTHLWEQEFVDSSGFRPYMAHPMHWTGIERWFDLEIPGHIVSDEAHYLSSTPVALLTS